MANVRDSDRFPDRGVDYFTGLRWYRWEKVVEITDQIELTDDAEVIMPMEVDSDGVVSMTDSLDTLHAPPESRVGYARVGYSEVTILGFGGANDFVTLTESFAMDATLGTGDTVGMTDSLATVAASPESRVGTAEVGYSEVA